MANTVAKTAAKAAAKPAGRRARGTQVAGAQAQQHLLRAAEELFYQEGFAQWASMRSSSARASTR